MFAKELRQEGHTRKFSIMDRGCEGWEVREEADDRVLKQVCYTDWHRVERALGVFQLQIGELEGLGWSVAETGL